MGGLTPRLFILLLALALSPSGWADDRQERQDHRRALELTRAGTILPLEQILLPFMQRHPGRVLEVELEEEDGRLVYEVELLEGDGRVWEYLIDPYNGQLIRRYQED